MKHHALILGLLLTCASASAQERRIIVNSTLDLSAGYDRKSVVGGPRVSDPTWFATPSFYLLTRLTPNTDFRTAYQPELSIYTGDSDSRFLSHTARLGFSHRFNPRLSFELSDAFLMTRDPARHLGNSFLLLPETRYRENSVYAGFDYDVSPLWKWSIRADNTTVKYNLPREYRSGFLDQTGLAYTTSLAHQLGPHKKITGTYSTLSVRLLDSDQVTPDTGAYPRAHYLTATYTNDVSPGFTYGINGGVIRASDLSYVIGGQIQTLVTNRMWLDASYNRSLSFYGSPVLGPGAGYSDTSLATGNLNNVYQMASVALRGPLTTRLHYELRVTAAMNNARSASAGRSRSITGRVRFNYALAERVTAYALADLYAQNLNRFEGIPTSRGRVLGGLEFSLSKPAPRAHGPSAAPPPAIIRPGLPLP